MSVARHYYNEIDPYAVAWLRNLMEAGHIPAGDIDTRSIEDVRPSDLAGYVQCHFFAGIGGWPLALALAGWPVDRPVWTGSCPCQPFSSAGKRAGFADQRHLWPAWYHLISQQRPAIVFGEQVAAAVGHRWLDGVSLDLEGQDYAVGSSVLPACAVDAPHRRERLLFVADTDAAGLGTSRRRGLYREWQAGAFASQPDESALADAGGTGLAQRERERGVLREVGGQSQGKESIDGDRPMGHTDRLGGQVDTDARGSEEGSRAREVAGPVRPGHGVMGDADESCSGEGWQQRSWEQRGPSRDPWACAGWITGHDGKARRVESSIRLLAHGLPSRVGRLRAYGNAIVPQVAAEFIEAYAEARGLIAAPEAIAA